MGHIREINAAASRIPSFAKRTPFHTLDVEGVLFKREDLQESGSFKIRGAANRFLTVSEPARRNGVVTVSSGNTGRALCAISEKCSTSVHVFVLEDCETAKVAHLQRAGAEVHVAGHSFFAASLRARQFAHAHSMLFCSSSADWEFLHGVATIGLELHEDDPDLDVIYVPIGGGGLAAGVGLFYTALNGIRQPRIVGVQSSRSRPIYEHFHHGRIFSEPRSTAADCLAGEPEAGAIILEIDRKVLSDIVLVTDGEILEAAARLASRGILVEPGAAAGYAAYLRYADANDRTGVILTGAAITCEVSHAAFSEKRGCQTHR
ncbi:pyridoxal-phosphate dependent enzyme [Streptomyces sp. Li-HN-5-11]|uniref:pyridoxal-phosphate dependent enzyme n=1 Tax=Streptomyces sp. Li-HN-5-11 TaxID=3075432 RepID=UPI0028AE62D8|nr:pyridoxal-phosphate dependent enzyme [Streptomyces sp. Li-HN-5-11]WNM35022.1 pyridoxal-phosphate dependent enzyme [Streptomyces sp. Li-HN-5-11]